MGRILADIVAPMPAPFALGARAGPDFDGQRITGGELGAGGDEDELQVFAQRFQQGVVLRWCRQPDAGLQRRAHVASAAQGFDLLVHHMSLIHI